MKFSHILPLAALSTAFVIPDEQVLNKISIEDHHKQPDHSTLGKLPKIPTKELLDDLKKTYNHAVDASRNAIDEALASVDEYRTDAAEDFWDATYDTKAWIGDKLRDFEHREITGGGDEPPHHGPPHHDDPHHGDPHHDDPPHHGPPHHGPPHHGPHDPDHHKPNMTVYQLISESKYTTKLAKLINEDHELVQILNSTKANYTVFAPTDSAFEKIPDHAPKPPKEFIKKVLLYHISPDFYPASRVLQTHTIPTLFKEEKLAAEPVPQRLSVNVGLRGLTLNFYSRVVAINIFGTNGVIHGLSSLVIPPPSTLRILNFAPQDFSTLLLGLGETGFLSELNSTAHNGGTFFAPSNFAFKKLGPRINAFLFSKYGRKYLKALLQYHVVHNQTLYSDAYYSANGESESIVFPKDGSMDTSDDHHGDGPSKGYFHFDLPTLLEDKSLSVDVGRYGPFISMRINGFSRVVVQDGVAKDGVIQVVGDVLIPPKKVGGAEVQQWMGEELSVEELKERLAPLVEDDEDVEEDKQEVENHRSWWPMKWDL
ncbi:hypothetical protein LTS18_005614 [Coniosporium uncinatum]|uniref:Uncharacterized protein n=1 Tax=Coniosporium uncinatum TaxID=93489 RepID=A0ACC3DR18_9PEZI|nr:hypothetical protein LTS18_005614 [Coniosporium uncinatum]